MDLEIYFKDDVPKIVYGAKCKFANDDWEVIPYKDTFYYLAPARYNASMEAIQCRSLYYKMSVPSIENEAVMHGITQLIDVDRGDGFSLMLLDFNLWHKSIQNYTTPEIYKDEK